MAHQAHGGSYIGPVESQGPGTKPGTDHQVDNHEHHPGARTYIEVAVVLAIITAVEVAIYYIPALESVLVPLLIILSIAKFVAVVGFFMHLKFDDRRFRFMFIGGLVITFSVFIGLLAMQTFKEFEVADIPIPANREGAEEPAEH